MAAQIFTQFTPNPNALKFILDVPVMKAGGISYKDPASCPNNPLAAILLKFGHVKEVYFHENFITVTQDGLEDWEVLENKVREVILNNIQAHNPNIPGRQESSSTDAPSDAAMNQINEILDQTIRPVLQMDGGDVRLVSFENNVLRISYRGACGSCPGAAFGTLRAIERVLQEKYDSQIKVEMAGM
jgi:NFU1 iron-sulfur cluster scaffold homolog, mitochondrial